MNNKASLDISELKAIKVKIRTMNSRLQKEQIEQASPYSKDITSRIRSCDELRLYCSLQLKESILTRGALIADIDPALWISSENATNIELMSKGGSPYLFDSPEGKIELHHIGQSYDSPFAELTQEQHDIYNQVLHIAGISSWRDDPKAEKMFGAERYEYWIKRAQSKNVVAPLPDIQLSTDPIRPHQEYLTELRELCEEIYRQSSVEDLDFLSDLARSYALMGRIGAFSIGEFLRNIRKEQGKQLRCAYCSASDYVLYGTYQSQGERVQRYKCKQCQNVFTETAGTLIAGSSFSFKDWLKFIDCLYNGFSLSQIAKACDISEKTAHENRIKLFYALKLLNDKVTLEGHIVLDETFVPVNFKGNHSKQEGFTMPREAHRRGGENHKRGISDNHVCIVCAVDNMGNSVCEVCGTGNTTASKLNYVLEQHMGSEIVCLYSDKSQAIKRFATSCGYEIKQEKLLKKNAKQASNVTIDRNSFLVNRYLQKVNSYHSRLKRFLSRFSGISTKYLSGYLYLFAWKERNKDREPEDIYKELLQILAEPNDHLAVADILNGEYLPDAIKISADYLKRKHIHSPRDLSIGEKYASGRTMASIGEEYNMTRQNVTRIIKKLRYAGISCMPHYERAPRVEKHKYISSKVLDTLIRDYQIYVEKLQWTGSALEFNETMAKRYGISVQRVKNVVALIKRYMRLKEEIFIYDNISYQDIGSVYRMIYSDYLQSRQNNPHLGVMASAEMIAKKYGFHQTNIIRIVGIMSKENSAEYFSKKRKLTKTETFNRDKAIFIDYLRWTGIRSDFCRFAAEKYKISYHTVSTILKYCLYAVPERNEMV